MSAKRKVSYIKSTYRGKEVTTRMIIHEKNGHFTIEGKGFTNGYESWLDKDHSKWSLQELRYMRKKNGVGSSHYRKKITKSRTDLILSSRAKPIYKPFVPQVPRQKQKHAKERFGTFY